MSRGRDMWWIEDPYNYANEQYTRSRQKVETMEQRETTLGLPSGNGSEVSEYKLSVQREAEYNAKRLLAESERKTAEAKAERAKKKVEWAEYWMIYSIVLILALAVATFVVMHALAVK